MFLYCIPGVLLGKIQQRMVLDQGGCHELGGEGAHGGGGCAPWPRLRTTAPRTYDLFGRGIRRMHARFWQLPEQAAEGWDSQIEGSGASCPILNGTVDDWNVKHKARISSVNASKHSKRRETARES